MPDDVSQQVHDSPDKAPPSHDLSDQLDQWPITVRPWFRDAVVKVRGRLSWTRVKSQYREMLKNYLQDPPDGLNIVVPDEQTSPFFPSAPVTLPEKYAVLITMHDYLCSDAQRIGPADQDADDLDLFTRYRLLVNGVRTLAEEPEAPAWLEDALADVMADIGRMCGENLEPPAPEAVADASEETRTVARSSPVHPSRYGVATSDKVGYKARNRQQAAEATERSARARSSTADAALTAERSVPLVPAATEADQKRLTLIPRLDKESGKWVTQVVAARIEHGKEDSAGHVSTAYLKTARHQGKAISDKAKTCGIDRDGRMWRRDPNKSEIFWYLKSKLIDKSARSAT